jgi:hypothetical protein
MVLLVKYRSDAALCVGEKCCSLPRDKSRGCFRWRCLVVVWCSKSCVLFMKLFCGCAQLPARLSLFMSVYVSFACLFAISLNIGKRFAVLSIVFIQVFRLHPGLSLCHHSCICQIMPSPSRPDKLRFKHSRFHMSMEVLALPVVVLAQKFPQSPLRAASRV